MTKQSVKHSETKKNGLYLIMFFLPIIASLLLGCGKEKALEPKGAGPAPAPAPVGTCEIFDKLQLPKSIEINYGNKIKLSGITVNKISQNKIEISYFWQVMDDPGAYNVAFVHFTDKDNKALFQNDHAFCKNHSLSELKGKFIKESYAVDIPQSAVGKEVNILVGIYAPGLKTGSRLEVVSSKGAEIMYGNAAIVEKLKL